MAVPTPSIEELQSQISSLTARLAEKEEELKEKDTEILSLHAQVKLLNTRLKSGSEKVRFHFVTKKTKHATLTFLWCGINFAKRVHWYDLLESNKLMIG
jgi:hypothetical protein